MARLPTLLLMALGLVACPDPTPPPDPRSGPGIECLSLSDEVVRADFDIFSPYDESRVEVISVPITNDCDVAVNAGFPDVWDQGPWVNELGLGGGVGMLRVAGGSTASIPLQLQPRRPGRSVLTLGILEVFGDRNTVLDEVQVEAVVHGGALEWSDELPGVVSTPGCPADEDLQITNSGTATVTITGASSTPEGVIDVRADVEFPLIVEPGGVATLPFRVTPDREGTIDGLVQIESDAFRLPRESEHTELRIKAIVGFYPPPFECDDSDDG